MTRELAFLRGVGMLSADTVHRKRKTLGKRLVFVIIYAATLTIVAMGLLLIHAIHGRLRLFDSAMVFWASSASCFT